MGLLFGILLLPSLKTLKLGGTLELDTFLIEARRLELQPLLAESILSLHMALKDPLQSFRMPLQSIHMPLQYPLRDTPVPSRSVRPR